MFVNRNTKKRNMTSVIIVLALLIGGAQWNTVFASGQSDDADFKMGNTFYNEGLYNEAVKWWTRAAERGVAPAQYCLGYCYFNGEGVRRNYSKAVDWLTSAAIQGNVDAQNLLGHCYYEGKGVKKNYNTAVNWFSEAAEKGDAYAQYNLGRCYAEGKGVPKNESQAAFWFNKAAKQGNEGAKTALNKLGY